MINPHNPKILVFDKKGLPAAKAKVFFYEAGTDVPKSVEYVDAGTLTNEITADDSGKFPEVKLLIGTYTLKSFVPIDPQEPYPLFPDDYEILDTWDLSGEPEPSDIDAESVISLPDITALRTYDGDEEKIWINNRLYIKDTLVTQVDNNGTIIVSSALADTVWRMDVTGYDSTSVEWFGVVRTATDDSTAAFLTAISAIYNNDSYSAPYKLPRVLYIPEGTYRVTSDINFTCPVYMEQNVRFANTSNSAITLTFSGGLDTRKNTAMNLNLPGLSPIHLRFPNGGDVRLAWFDASTIDMDEHGSKIDIIGPGKLTISSGNTRRIGTLQTNGIVEFSGAAGSKIYVDNIISGGSNIKISGSATFRLYSYSDFRLSWLDNKSMLNRVNGQKLVIDENWDIDFDVDSTWGIVEGENWPSVVNTSGTVHTAMFYLGDVIWDTMSCSVHDITWLNKSRPSQMDWTNSDGNDWDNYLIYGSNDFSGTTTSGDIWLNKPSGITLYGLNHSGSIGNSFGALKLDTCTFNFTVNCTITSVFLEIVNSTVNTDDPSNGNIVSQNMRLRDSRIHSRVTVANGNDLEIEMRGCHFTNQISILATTNSVKTIVLKDNEVALCEFLPYRITVQSWSTDKVSIDISGNWTTDTTGQLVHSKGLFTAKPGSTTIESNGVVDFRNTLTGGSWISNTPFYHKGGIIGSAGAVSSQPSVDGTGAAIVTSIASAAVKVYGEFWTTQDW